MSKLADNQAGVRSKVAVAMSGGIDSSVAAALLVEQGYEVIGITARMWKDGSRCCSLEDIERARKVCWFLDIRHVVINAFDVFNSCVVERFAAEYARGRTPSPCVVCNQLVKFGLLLTRAVEFDCSSLATGHYARVNLENGKYRLLTALDSKKDQSYFLHRLSQDQLARVIFPLGGMKKQDDVVPYARKRGLPLDLEKESTDICFAPPGEHSRVVEIFYPAIRKKGLIVDSAGKRLGEHEGIHHFTIGQREGIGVAMGSPRYVTRINAETNTVEIGERNEAMGKECIVEDARWVAGSPPVWDKTYSVRIRYRHSGVSSQAEQMPDGRLKVTFAESQFAVTPGQAAVFYDGDEVLGGGWISAVETGGSDKGI